MGIQSDLASNSLAALSFGIIVASLIILPPNLTSLCHLVPILTEIYMQSLSRPRKEY